MRRAQNLRFCSRSVRELRNLLIAVQQTAVAPVHLGPTIAVYASAGGSPAWSGDRILRRFTGCSFRPEDVDMATVFTATIAYHLTVALGTERSATVPAP